MKKLVKIYLLLFANIFVSAQNLYLPLNNDIALKYENQVYNNQENFHTAIKPYNIGQIKNYNAIASSIKKNQDKYLLRLGDTARFIEFFPYVNLERQLSSNFSDFFAGGIGLRTQMLDNLSFFGYFALNKFSYFDWYDLHGKVTPHYGEYILNANDVNFGYFRGYLSYSPGKYFNFQLGRDKNFFGDGYRSLLMSDNSDAFEFLKGNVTVWKVKYTILFSHFRDIDSEYTILSMPSLSNTFKDKFSTSHFLSWNVSKRFNFNLFETVIWRGQDSIWHRGFDVNYLNPIVFFRPVEFSLGSPDNVLMGGGFRVKVAKSNHFYGQFILDEFKLSEIKARNGWWANKYGFQLGFKTYNLFNISNLFLLMEYNQVRPFTYSHGSSLENWGNAYQPMAHPLGANFTEQIFIIKYPYKRYMFTLKTIFSQHGENYFNDVMPLTVSSDVNYGGDIYVSYNDRINEYGNTQNQGYLRKLYYIDFKISALVLPDWNMMFFISNKIYKSESTHYIFTIGLKTALYNDDIDY